MTNAEKIFDNVRANYVRFYGANAKPIEVVVEIETEEGIPYVVDIAFGAENKTENHYDHVNGWDDLRVRAARGAKRKFGYRVIGILDYTASNPIVYTGSDKS